MPIKLVNEGIKQRMLWIDEDSERQFVIWAWILLDSELELENWNLARAQLIFLQFITPFNIIIIKNILFSKHRHKHVERKIYYYDLIKWHIS